MDGWVKKITMVEEGADATTDYQAMLFDYDEDGRVVKSQQVESMGVPAGVSISTRPVMTPIGSTLELSTRADVVPDGDSAAEISIIEMVYTYEFDYAESGSSADMSLTLSQTYDGADVGIMSSDGVITFNSDGTVSGFESDPVVYEKGEDYEYTADTSVSFTYDSNGYLSECLSVYSVDYTDPDWKYDDCVDYDKETITIDASGNLTGCLTARAKDSNEPEDYDENSNMQINYGDDENSLNLDIVPIIIGTDYSFYLFVQPVGFYGKASTNLPTEIVDLEDSSVTSTFTYTFDADGRLTTIVAYNVSRDEYYTYTIEYFEAEDEE